MALGFVNQQYLVYLLLLPAAWLMLFGAYRIRKERCRRLGLQTAEHRVLNSAVVGASIVSLTAIALTRPYWGYEDVELKSSSRDILFLVDVSTSMRARDIAPDRLTAAKRKMLDFIELVRKQSSGDKIGILVFAGEAYLFCPLTADYGVLNTFIDAVDAGLIANGDTDLNNALETALKSFDSSGADKSTLLLFSDGEDLALNLSAAVYLLKNRGIRLYSLGIGTSQGRPIEGPGGGLIRDAQNNIVVSKLNETALKQLAQNSSGAYARITVDNSDIEGLYQSISRNFSAARSRDQLRIYQELGPYLLAAALFIIILCYLIGRPGWVLAAILLSVRSEAQSPTPDPQPGILSPYEAARAYERGDYESAIRGFERKLKRSPQDLNALQALASAYYKKGLFAESSRLFSELAQRARNGRRRFEALYNLGNSNLMEEQYQKAVDNYQMALEIKPGDEKAKFNLAIARQLLERQTQGQSSAAAGPQPDEKSFPQDSTSSAALSESPSFSGQGSSESAGRISSDSSERAGSADTAQSQSSSSNDPATGGKNDAAGHTERAATEDSAVSHSGSNSTFDSAPSQPSLSSARASNSAAASGYGTAGSLGISAEPQYAADKKRAYDPAPLNTGEAQAWLESLPDSPVLLKKRQTDRARQGMQRW